MERNTQYVLIIQIKLFEVYNKNNIFSFICKILFFCAILTRDLQTVLINILLDYY